MLKIDYMKKDFAFRLKEFRVRFNYSIDDIAAFLNVTKQKVMLWESGEEEMSIEEIDMLAELYGVEASDFVDLTKGINACYDDLDEDREVSLEKENKINERIKNEKETIKQKRKLKFRVFINGWIDGILLAISVIIYFILGSTLDRGFTLYWPLICFSLFISSIIKSVLHKRFSKLNFIILYLGIFFQLLMIDNVYDVFNAWPLLILFLLITPLSYYLAKVIDIKLSLRKRKR